jgi:DNA-binding NarL/FixJ family response regulator
MVDDHELFRESLAHLLAAEAEFQVVAHVPSVEQAAAVLGKQPVDVVLLDFDLGVQRAPQFLERIRALPVQPRILLVTAGIVPLDAAALLNDGVASSPGLLIDVIRKVHAGETWVDQRCLRDLAKAVVQPVRHASERQFTERERDVLRGVFEGRSNKEISAALGISESSVKAAIQQLFQKTGVRSRSQLVRTALERFSGEWE